MTLTQLRRWCATVAGTTVLACAAPGGAATQELYGSVVGTVTDGSGARIPGATIEIVNTGTNLTLTTVSNETGAYTLTNVLPGTYDVKVTLQGFKEFVRQSVPVTTGAISRVDARLEVGELSEVVTVQSEVQLLKTDKADTGSAFTSQEVVDLPLPDFRNYQSLIDLVPGPLRPSSRTRKSTRLRGRSRRPSTGRTATTTARAWTAPRTSSPGCRTIRCTSRRRRRSPPST